MDGHTESSSIEITRSPAGQTRFSRSYTIDEQPVGRSTVLEQYKACLVGPAAPLHLFGLGSEHPDKTRYSPDQILSLLPPEAASLQVVDFLRRALIQDRMDWKTASTGLRTVIRVVELLADQSAQPSLFPLLMDEPAAVLDSSMARDVWSILELIGQQRQVIVAARVPPAHASGRTILLPSRDSSNCGVVGFAYRLGGHLRQQKPPSSRPPSFSFSVGDRYQGEETRRLEFKEVKGGRAVGSICKLVDQYVVAFLNSADILGTILWGVRDEDRRVVGVHLPSEQRDNLRKRITDKLHNITPTIPPTAYRLELLPVWDRESPKKDLFIVSVTVPRADNILLYSTGGQEIYVKTDAGKKHLSALEIQHEVLSRAGYTIQTRVVQEE